MGKEYGHAWLTGAGERYYREYEDEDGQFTTHVPYSNIAKCTFLGYEMSAVYCIYYSMLFLCVM